MNFPVNPNDGLPYVWDFNNDVYMRVERKPPNEVHPGGLFDFIDCSVTLATGSARDLMAKHGLVLNTHDFRTEEELDHIGAATLFLDTTYKVIGLYHNVGIVASIPEWREMDWFQVYEDFDQPMPG